MNDRTAVLGGCTLSVSASVQPLLQRLLANADALGVRVSRGERGVCLIDAGVDAPGSVAAGMLVGEICMGGLGSVALRCASEPSSPWPTWLDVASAQPVLSCLGSQYAGWSLAASKEETGGKKFFALGSGPVRALARKEPLFAELGYVDRLAPGQQAVLVLEVDKAPPAVVVDKVLRDASIAAEALTVIVTPTRSAAGTTQVVARVLEVALHKAHELHFDLANIVDGSATAPLPAPSPDGLQAMGRTNDAILYGGRVHLSVRGGDDAAKALAAQLPSCNSRDHGRSFAALFEAAGFDFYKLDGALFAPAEVWVSNRDSGSTFHGGRCEFELLRTLWLAA